MKMKKRIMVLVLLSTFMMTACKGKSASSYYKDGNQSMEKKDYEAAVISYMQAIENNPEKADYYIASGFALIGLERFEEAINQFDKAYSEKNNQVVRENNKTLLRGKGIANLRLGKYDRAKVEFEEALKLKEFPELDSDIKQYIALVEMKLGNYEEAIKLYEAMLEFEKPDADSYLRLARAYRQTGKAEKAIASYEEAIKLNKDIFDAYFGEYELYMDEGEEDKAREALERAAGIKVTDDLGTYNHGVLEFLRGNFEKAIIDFEVAYDKKILEASYYLGKIAERNKKYSEAKLFYERYQTDVGFVSLSGWYDGMATCEMEEGNYEKALNLVNKGLTLDDISFMKSLLLKKIAIEEKLNHYLAAYESTQAFLKLYPNHEGVLKENQFLKTRLKKAKKK